MSIEVYPPLYWMGQTLGLVMMAATLGVWRHAATVAGTTIGNQTSWRSILAVIWMQAASRFAMGLSEQLDAHMALPQALRIPGEGPFMWVGLALATLTLPALWPIWRMVGERALGPRLANAAAAVGVGVCALVCVGGARSVAAYVDLCAMSMFAMVGGGMLVLSFSPGAARAGSLVKVRLASMLGIVIGALFGVAACVPDGREAAWAAGACFYGSMVLIVSLHARIKEISKGRAAASPWMGALAAVSGWAALATVGPALWALSSKPAGPMYRDYMMALGLLSALFVVSWHFRHLNLSVSRYIERLGRDRARALLVGVKAAAFLVDAGGRVVDCSKEAESLTGSPVGELAGRSVWEILEMEAGEGSEFEGPGFDGRQVVVAREGLGDDLAGLEVITARDVTSERSARLALDRAAREDELTGLPNRREALARIDAKLAELGAGGSLGALFMDLDHFKNVNDTEGHAAGDELLREAGLALSEAMELAGGWLARLGGDEFLGVLPGGSDFECEMAARRCIEAMEACQRAAKGSVGVSVGVAIHPRDGEQAIDLIRRADAAMYEAKTRGRGGVSFFGEAIERKLRRRVQVEGFARESLKSETGLSLALQPLCAMDGTFIGQVEALIRAPGMPDLGAQELVDIAEQSGLILPLGRWVLRQAADVQREATAKGLSFSLSVNVSARQFMDELFWDQFRGMARLGHFPRGVTLEVTESTLSVDRDRAARLLAEARSLGARVALDDFGAGYSSLSALKRMPLDRLKLDKSLIDSVPEDVEAQRVAAAAIAMAQALGLDVVAEGVERPEQAKWLASRGVLIAQGFLFAKPMPVAQFIQILQSGRRVFFGEPK